MFHGRITDASWTPAAGDAVKISIRPECLRIHSGGAIHGTVTEKIYLGQCIQYWVDTPCGKLQVVELNPQKLYTPGDSLQLAVDPDDLLVLSH
jgi:ABC-type Fe3+/spermidine/putrescine transport system ATPase subunit